MKLSQMRLWPWKWFGGGLSRQQGIQDDSPSGRISNLPVTFDTSMQLSAVWSCVRLLTETISSLPIEVYDTSGEFPERVLDSDVAELFSGNRMVNPWQNKVEFLETYCLNLVLAGNGYAIKVFNGSRLVGLKPINHDQVEVKLLPDGTVTYRMQDDDGNLLVFGKDSIWHTKLFGTGVVGFSPMNYGSNSIGIGIAGERITSRVFRKGGKPPGILSVDQSLKKEQADYIRKEFRKLKESKDDDIMVLQSNMTKFDKISMTPEDIELLNSRRFQIEDICRFFGVPSILVNDTQSSTSWGTGIEQIVNGFYRLTLRPYLNRLETSIKTHLIPDELRRRREVRINIDPLIMADRSSRIASYKDAINSAIMTPNEARKREMLPPVDGGDNLLVQGAMIPLSQALGGSDAV